MSVYRTGRNIMKAVLYRIGQYNLSDCSPCDVSYPKACHISQCMYTTVSLTLFPVATRSCTWQIGVIYPTVGTKLGL